MWMHTPGRTWSITASWQNYGHRMIPPHEAQERRGTSSSAVGSGLGPRDTGRPIDRAASGTLRSPLRADVTQSFPTDTPFPITNQHRCSPAARAKLVFSNENCTGYVGPLSGETKGNRRLIRVGLFPPSPSPSGFSPEDGGSTDSSCPLSLPSSRTTPFSLGVFLDLFLSSL